MSTTHQHDALDFDLITAVAAGEQSAFERLYHRYATRVFQYVRTLVSDDALAEDVVGETMIAVWSGAATFTRASRVSTWIFGIARHKALDAVRCTGRRPREVDLDGAADMPAHGDTPFEGVYQKEVEGLMRCALAALSPEHQEVLRLVFYEEFPYEEIARVLAIPTNTVKTRVYYAKQHLRRQLERLGQKEPIK